MDKNRLPSVDPEQEKLLSSGVDEQGQAASDSEDERASAVSGMSRRRFLGVLGGAFLLSTLASCEKISQLFASPESSKARSIDEQRAIISKINADNPNSLIDWSPQTIADRLTEGLDEKAARVKLFEFVQSFPYLITSFDPSRGDIALYDSEQGDCRHKRDALCALLSKKGEAVRRVAVPFDWSDLPIPKDILSIRKRSGTVGFHSGMDVKIGGRWVSVDPTWDPGLIQAGFPVNTDWDGVSPNKNITFGDCPRVQHGEYDTIGDLYERFSVPYPVKSENDSFVQALNAWFRKVRTK